MANSAMFFVLLPGLRTMKTGLFLTLVEGEIIDGKGKKGRIVTIGR